MNAKYLLAAATGNYEVDRQRHVKAFKERLASEVKKVTWPLEKLQDLRDKRLRHLIKVAKKYSPWHAARLRQIDPETIKGNNLSDIQTMTKTDLMENWDEIVTDRRLNLDLANHHIAHISDHGPAYLFDQYHVVTSGGSSGKRGVFVVDFEGWLCSSLAISRYGMWIDQNHKWEGAKRHASIGAGLVTHASIAAFQTFFGEQVGNSRSFPILLPIHEIVDGLNEFQPSHLIAYPSILHRLALEKKAGRLSITPQSMMCVAEPLMPETREVLEDVFGKPPMNMYGSSEGGGIAYSFPGSPGMYLMEDMNVYEPVDANGRSVPPGVMAAKLLITNVANQALPLIRYELTDEVLLLNEPNPNPWTGRRIADIKGRVDDHFLYPGNVDVPPLLFWTVFGKTPEVFEYQVQQTRRGVKILVRATQPFKSDTIHKEIANALIHLGLSDPELVITEVDHIDRHAETGKLRRFIPLTGQ